MEQRLIDANELKEYMMFKDDMVTELAHIIIDVAPTIDPVEHGYVSKEVLDQIRWERDIAMSYLEEAGIGFGEKAELQRVKRGQWEIWYMNDNTAEHTCSECGSTYFTEEDDLGFNYCPNCGARMDGE